MSRSQSNAKITKTKTITLQQSIVDKVEERARVENRTFSNMVETILLESVPKVPSVPNPPSVPKVPNLPVPGVPKYNPMG